MERDQEKGIVVEGKNVEEALQAACDMLDTTPNQVDYEVRESGHGGMLGFLKGKTYKVRVWAKSASEKMLEELVSGLFKRLQFKVDLTITRTDEAYEIDIETDGADGLLIGRGGETLTGLQHLISRMAGQREEGIRVRVDVAGYRKRRHEQLRRTARDLAARALSSGREIMTEPLPADERRIVHMALAEDARVETRALGDAPVKRVTIVPRARGRSSAGREPRGRGQDGRAQRASRHAQGSRRHSGGRPERGEGREDREGREGSERTGGDRGPRGSGRERRAPAAPAQREPSVVEAEADERLVGQNETARTDEAGRGGGRSDSRSRSTGPEDDSYFRIPTSLDPSERTDAGDDSKQGAEEGESKPKEITYGRRPQAGRGRRR